MEKYTGEKPSEKIPLVGVPLFASSAFGATNWDEILLLPDGVHA